MQKVKYFFGPLLIILIVSAFSSPSKPKIKWLTVEELQIAYAREARPILIDVYTSWCGWCKVMDRETYSKQTVADYINTHYYAVKLDAESTSSISLNGKKYNFLQSTGTNELANYLLAGQMAYPTTVFLSSLDARPAPLAGYLKPNELEAPLKYYGEAANKRMSFDDYMKTFNGSWK